MARLTRTDRIVWWRRVDVPSTERGQNAIAALLVVEAYQSNLRSWVAKWSVNTNEMFRSQTFPCAAAHRALNGVSSRRGWAILM